MATNRVSTFYDEAIASGAGKNRVSATFAEVITSSNQPKTRISALYTEIIAGLTSQFVDLAGNLGGVSSYGRFHYGLAKYSRVNAFAPIFSGDVTVTAGSFAGSLAPQVALRGSLSLDLSLNALAGSFGFTVVYGPSEMISGPLWGEEESPPPPWETSEPCPPPVWASSDPCPPPAWGRSDPCPPPAWMISAPCDTVVWSKSRLCNG